jgi:hypothetical protein
MVTQDNIPSAGVVLWVSDSNTASCRIGRPVSNTTISGWVDSNNTSSVVNPLLAGAANRISQDVDMVTLRFNFCFGWGNPVVAHYRFMLTDREAEPRSCAGLFAL